MGSPFSEAQNLAVEAARDAQLRELVPHYLLQDVRLSVFLFFSFTLEPKVE